MTLPRRPGALAAAGRIVRAGAAFAALTALLGGVPWALVRYVGWPLPRSVPSLDQLRVTLGQPLGEDLVVHTLACLVWLGWAQLALAAACEAGALLRGASPPRLPCAGPAQTLAALLIGAVALPLLSDVGRASASTHTALSAALPGGAGRPVAAAPAIPGVPAADATPALLAQVLHAHQLAIDVVNHLTPHGDPTPASAADPAIPAGRHPAPPAHGPARRHALGHRRRTPRRRAPLGRDLPPQSGPRPSRRPRPERPDRAHAGVAAAPSRRRPPGQRAHITFRAGRAAPSG